MLLFGHDQSFMDLLAWRVAAVSLWIATWWATEAIPVPATAFLPIVVFAPLGIVSIKAAAPCPNHDPITPVLLPDHLMVGSFHFLLQSPGNLYQWDDIWGLELLRSAYSRCSFAYQWDDIWLKRYPMVPDLAAEH